MSNIIDIMYEKTPEITKESNDIRDNPLKGYRTLYFDNKIDIRLCPKNANTSLKYAYSLLQYNIDSHFGFSKRKFMYDLLMEKKEIDEKSGLLLFRYNSYKIALKRDPIDRALSAVKYLLETRLNIIEPSIELIEEFLININLEINEVDHHLLPQTFWMGNSNVYDKIYYVKEFKNMIEYLQDNYIWFDRIDNIHKNPSKNKLNTNALSDNTIKKLKKIYEIDYDNGWY